MVDFDFGLENITNRLLVCRLVQYFIAMAFMKYLLPVLAASQAVLADSCEYPYPDEIVQQFGHSS